MKRVLIIGGCRSGKSRFALECADGFRHKVFVATCEPLDAEMEKRVQRHRQDRGPDWTTVEAPLEPARVIEQYGAESDVILIDCLTLWITNLLLKGQTEQDMILRVDDLLACAKKARCRVIMVANEVGTGIVPENFLSRMFRDLAGMVNQRVAAFADKVVWMVAGIPVVIKG